MSAPGMGLGRERQERQAWPAGPYRVVGNKWVSDSCLDSDPAPASYKPCELADSVLI